MSEGLILICVGIFMIIVAIIALLINMIWFHSKEKKLLNQLKKKY